MVSTEPLTAPTAGEPKLAQPTANRGCSQHGP